MRKMPSGSWTVLSIPQSHYHCQLDNLDWSVYTSSKRKAVFSFIEAAEAGKSPHLILTGKTGAGKSHIVVGLYRWAARKWGTRNSLYMDVPEWCDRIKAGYGRDISTSHMWEDVENAHCFIGLDDAFSRDFSAHEKDLVFRMITTGYKKNAAMIFAVNLSIDELQNKLNPHEMSRLTDNSIGVVDFPDDLPDYRSK